MKNIYVTRFKEIIMEYYNQNSELNKKIDALKEKYVADYYEEQKRPLTEKQNSLAETAKTRIINITNELIEALGCASIPQAEMITSDAKLFVNGVIAFTPSEVSVFIQKYENNPTMLRIISTWIQSQEEPLVYANCEMEIKTPRQKAEVYKKYADSALRLIQQIHDDKNISKLFVDSYGDETAGYELLNTIKTGLEVSDYKPNTRTPEIQRNTFSDLFLSADSTGNTTYYAQ